jgi:DNA-binding IclR family transcriptional regulator
MFGTLAKASSVLEIFTPDKPEWGASAVAAQLQIPKSSASDLLAALSELGFLRRVGRGRYRLGWRILQMNRILLDTTSSLRPPNSVLQRAADILDTTIHVAAMRDGEVICIDEARRGVAVGGPRSYVGKAIPPTSALAAVLRSSASDEAIGIAIDLEESIRGVCCVAALIPNAVGRPETAVGFGVPRLQFERDLASLRRLLYKISHGPLTSTAQDRSAVGLALNQSGGPPRWRALPVT